MNKKKVLIYASAIIIAGLIISAGILRKDENNSAVKKTEKQEQQEIINNQSSKGTNKALSGINRENKSLKGGITEENNVYSEKNSPAIRANLYNDLPASALPLSAIYEISNVPDNIRETVADISKNYNIYMVQKHKDKLLIISDNPENIRHGIEFTELNILNGHQIKTTLGYNDKIKDSQNDIWAYDKETNQPVKHTKYDSNGDIEFVEEWNYDSDNPVKYEMKDSEGKVISMRKETLNDGTDLRIEHLLYDKDGHTRITVSATYDGDEVKRFTYYNADKTNDSCSIFSDYTDGQKTKETVYTSDLKIKNTYSSDYKDGNRENIIIYDNKNHEVNKLIPEENL